MGTDILWGRDLAWEITHGVALEVERLIPRVGRAPGLAVILVGKDPASHLYVSHKALACQETGILSWRYDLPDCTSLDEVLTLVKELNSRDEVDGILVQLPLPSHLDQSVIIEAISPDKDVDGFHPYNMGRLALGEETMAPCTPKGVMALLDHYGIPIEGREVVLVGASNIVGKPLALMLLNRMATVTVCHIMTRDLASHTRRAEILLTATGVPHLIKREMVKEGAVVVDIGISKVQGKTVGDADFQELQGWAGAITPVPGGVGPMTVAMLMENTVQAFKQRVGIE